MKKINRRTAYATAAAAVLGGSMQSTAASPAGALQPLHAQRTLSVWTYVVATTEEAAVTIENLIGTVELEHVSLCPNLAGDAYVLLVIFNSGAPES